MHIHRVKQRINQSFRGKELIRYAVKMIEFTGDDDNFNVGYANYLYC